MHLESNEVKLTLLKSNLSDYDLQLISHLTLESCNYSIDIDLVKRKLLNGNLINAIFNKILSYKPEYDAEYFSISEFVAEIRADLAELKGSYKLDYFEEPSAGNKLMSHLIFGKLPSQLKSKIIHKAGQNYPTLNDIFKSYSEVIRTLLLTRFPQEKTEQFPKRRDNKYNNSYKSKEDTEKPALQIFVTYFQRPYCILCNMNSHQLSSCKKYSSFEERKNDVRN